eukprot:4967463-Pyramimonas_sp.AAC.1
MWFQLFGRGRLAAPGPRPATGHPAPVGVDCVVPSTSGASLIWTPGPRRPTDVGTTHYVFVFGWLEAAFVWAFPLRSRIL